MTIKVGDKLPSVTLRYVAPDGVKAVTTDEFFGGKKVGELGKGLGEGAVPLARFFGRRHAVRHC